MANALGHTWQKMPGCGRAPAVLLAHVNMGCMGMLRISFCLQQFLLSLLASANRMDQRETQRQEAGCRERDSANFLSLSDDLTHHTPLRSPRCRTSLEVPFSAEFCPCTKINVLTRKQQPGRMMRNGGSLIPRPFPNTF